MPVLVFIVNFIKGNFGIKTECAKDTLVKEEPVKIIEALDTVIRRRKSRSFKGTFK